ncbi:MAG: PilZ domain-containing protein [Acidobacteriia bacterium]|nr:PilZ domain-containing protein [Terriglobia bacterium]
MNGSQRAQRFAIAMPIQYRSIHEINWLEGTVENISSTGVLLRGPQIMSVATPIQMRFELPAEFGGQTGALVVCRGEVVRALLPPAENAPKALAATILDYTFVRGANGQP